MASIYHEYRDEISFSELLERAFQRCSKTINHNYDDQVIFSETFIRDINRTARTITHAFLDSVNFTEAFVRDVTKAVKTITHSFFDQVGFTEKFERDLNIASKTIEHDFSDGVSLSENFSRKILRCYDETGKLETLGAVDLSHDVYHWIPRFVPPVEPPVQIGWSYVVTCGVNEWDITLNVIEMSKLESASEDSNYEISLGECSLKCDNLLPAALVTLLETLPEQDIENLEENIMLHVFQRTDEETWTRRFTGILTRGAGGYEYNKTEHTHEIKFPDVAVFHRAALEKEVNAIGAGLYGEDTIPLHEAIFKLSGIFEAVCDEDPDVYWKDFRQFPYTLWHGGAQWEITSERPMRLRDFLDFCGLALNCFWYLEYDEVAYPNSGFGIRLRKRTKDSSLVIDDLVGNVKQEGPFLPSKDSLLCYTRSGFYLGYVAVDRFGSILNHGFRGITCDTATWAKPEFRGSRDSKMIDVSIPANYFAWAFHFSRQPFFAMDIWDDMFKSMPGSRGIFTFGIGNVLRRVQAFNKWTFELAGFIELGFAAVLTYQGEDLTATKISYDKSTNTTEIEAKEYL